MKFQEAGEMRAARVQFGGIVRQVSLAFVREARLGDYVMVHVGFAISLVDSFEAEPGDGLSFPGNMQSFALIQKLAGKQRASKTHLRQNRDFVVV